MERTKGNVFVSDSECGWLDIIQQLPAPAKLQAEGIKYICGDTICSVDHKNKSIQKARAEHLVKCWNAFEEGGLVEQLLDVCKFAISPEAPFSTNQLEFANRIIEAIHKKAEAALAAAEGKE